MTFRIKNLFAATLALAWATANVSAQVVSSLGNLPLYFEAQGRGGAAQFLAHSHDGQVLISAAGAQINLNNATVRAQFLGANPRAKIRGDAELGGKINYFTGSDPAQWRTGIPTFCQVRIGNLYPGVDAVYYGNQRQLEYDLNLAPGVSPQQVAIRFSGVDKLSVNPQGQLALFAGGSEIDQAKPVIYQWVAGVRREIDGGYKIVDAQTVAFAVGRYDHRLPLVIDPILSYSTYFGGISGTTAYAVALDTNDNTIFVAGQTLSSNLTTNKSLMGTNAFQTKYQGGVNYGDAFIAKFNQPGTNALATNLVYLTYLGGSNEDLASAIAVDPAGHAYVAGYTDSPNFPLLNSIPGVTNKIGGAILYGYYPFDAFVTELTADGSGLVYSTYLGGSGADGANAIAVDAAGNAYVTGYTFSTNFPVLNPVPFQLKGRTNATLGILACTNTYFNCNGFIAKIAAGGTHLAYSSYFGGNNYDVGTGIAVDNSSNVYVTGYTSSTNFPNQNAFQPYLNQSSNLIFNLDAYVAKLGETNSTPYVIYSSFLGSSNDDEGYHLALDSKGAAYVVGWTTSPYFPNTRTNLLFEGVTNNLINGIATTNVFLTKITNSAANVAGIAYSTIFGGFRVDIAYGVAVDPAGDAFVAGSASSLVFPTTNTLGFLRATNSGINDAFVTAFDPACSNVLYSVMFGGANEDAAYAIAVDSASTAYVVGQTASIAFPVTTASTNFPIYSAEQSVRNGTNNAFLAKILINQFELPLVITPVVTNSISNGKTNHITDKVTLSWRDYTEPEIGSYALLTTTNLAKPNWQLLSVAPTLSGNTNYLTLPATNAYRFFRLTN